MDRKEKRRKAVSPVIATTLLVAMVVVVGLIVFLWFKGFTQEAITKFGGTNIELICKDVEFDSSYSGGILSISDIGNVPIYSFKVKVEKPGSHETFDIENIVLGWPDTGLNQGGIFSGDISSSASGAEKIVLIPVLRGISDSGARTHACDEQYGKEIIL
ncbi:MAG: archaellin/type IV pilin N-terminal domain-containing protein [Nanoarchaeota archaeon]